MRTFGVTVVLVALAGCGGGSNAADDVCSSCDPARQYCVVPAPGTAPAGLVACADLPDPCKATPDCGCLEREALYRCSSDSRCEDTPSPRFFCASD